MVIAFTGAALAAVSISDCSSHTGVAPTAYVSSGCDSVCTFDTGTKNLTCDMEQGGSDTWTSATAVTDYKQNGGDNLSAWGNANSTGTLFCCYVTYSTNDVDRVTLLGTDSSGITDYLSFTYANNGTNLESKGWASGKGGPDVITGADFDRAGCDFEDGCADEYLYGGNGQDTIDGRSGNDYLAGESGGDDLSGGGERDAIYGGDNPDTIDGGADDDYIEAGAGDDDISGGYGDDEIWCGDGDDHPVDGGYGVDIIEGEDGDDTIKGGPGADHLNGGAGADTLCAGSGTGDFLDDGGGSGADKLWAPAAAVSPTGSTHVGDLCGDTGAQSNGWAGGSCTYSLSSPPTGC